MRDEFGPSTTMDVKPEAQAKMDAINSKELAKGQSQSDAQLQMIAKAQGFDGKPQLVNSVDDVLAKQKAEGGMVVYRGVSDYAAGLDENVDYDYELTGQANEAITYSGQQAAEQFQSGEYRAGNGAFGSGNYTAVDSREAMSYAKDFTPDAGRMGNGVTLAMHIPKSARMPSKEIVRATAKESRAESADSFAGHYNIGRLLAAKGYQAYDVGFLQEDKTGYINVLDRSMLTVSKELIK